MTGHLLDFVGTGYDRDVDQNTSPGTPGYANVAVNVVFDDRDDAATDEPLRIRWYCHH